MLTAPPDVTFQLYSSVQARRGANDVAIDNQRKLYGQGHHGNSQQSQNHPSPGGQARHYAGCNYGANTCGYPANQQNGYAYCRSNGVSEIGDLLQDYLEQGKQMGRKNNGTRHVVRKSKFLSKHLKHVPFYICV